MIHLRSLEEARASPVPEGVRGLVVARAEELAAELEAMGRPWQPEEDGWFVVLEPGEEVGPLIGLGWEQQLSDLLFEFVDHDEAAGCFAAVYIPTNNWGVTIVVPDAPGLDPAVRAWLVGQCEASAGGAPWTPGE